MNAAQNQPQVFNTETFLAQVRKPLVTINLSHRLPAHMLQKHFRNFIKKISKRCTCFVGKEYERPKLPSSQEFASIAFTMDNAKPAIVCFKLWDLYCMGVLGPDDVLYQVGNVGDSRRIIANSVFLGISERYGDLLGLGTSSGPLQMDKHRFENAYYAFSALGTPAQNFRRVAFGLGITAMGFMEPCRQASVQAWMVGEPGRHCNTQIYGEIVYKDEVWQTVHNWKVNSLAAEGMKEKSDGSLVWTNDKKSTLEAQKEVLIVKSNPDTPDARQPS